MLTTEIPPLDTKRDMQKLPETLDLPRAQSIFVPTLKDCLIVALISIVVLICSSILMYGASNTLGAGIIGWITTFVMVVIAVITINLIMLLSYSHSKKTI